MSDSHDFCRITLKAAREAKIALPKRITALQGTTCITNGQYFIEADGVKGEFYHGDCAFDAKTKYVRAIIDGALVPEVAVAQDKDYTFHGVPCSQVTFAVWMEQRNHGECPFCHRRLMSKYNNTNRHIAVCPKKPKVEDRENDQRAADVAAGKRTPTPSQVSAGYGKAE